jgi:hypothetical protein
VLGENAVDDLVEGAMVFIGEEHDHRDEWLGTDKYDKRAGPAISHSRCSPVAIASPTCWISRYAHERVTASGPDVPATSATDSPDRGGDRGVGVIVWGLAPRFGQ